MKITVTNGENEETVIQLSEADACYNIVIPTSEYYKGISVTGEELMLRFYKDVRNGVFWLKEEEHKQDIKALKEKWDER